MMKRRTPGGHATRLLLVGAMSAGLAACGGSSGDGDPGFDGDSGDFEPFEPFDGEDGDFDEDGILNSADPDYVNGDEDGDGLLNLEDEDFTVLDADGDGVPNGLDPDFTRATFMGDYDGDGFDDNPVFVTPDANDPCGSNGQGDPDSSNETWNDNCTVSQRGQFSRSYYTAGVQRVVYCADLGADTFESTQSVDEFADGIFGGGTQGAVVNYQRARGLGPDGIVGPMSWGEMRLELTDEPITRASLVGDDVFDGYGVEGDRCAGEVLFLAEIGNPDPNSVGTGIVGWALSTSSTNPEPLPFSIDPPDGL